MVGLDFESQIDAILALVRVGKGNGIVPEVEHAYPNRFEGRAVLAREALEHCFPENFETFVLGSSIASRHEERELVVVHLGGCCFRYVEVSDREDSTIPWSFW